MTDEPGAVVSLSDLLGVGRASTLPNVRLVVDVFVTAYRELEAERDRLRAAATTEER